MLPEVVEFDEREAFNILNSPEIGKENNRFKEWKITEKNYKVKIVQVACGKNFTMALS